MKNQKSVTYAIMLLLLGMIIVPHITANVAWTSSEIPKSLDTVESYTKPSHLVVDAFIIGKIQDLRNGQLGVMYVNATFVYTTEFHKFYTGEIEITGFRGILTSSFICGFYNDGW